MDFAPKNKNASPPIHASMGTLGAENVSVFGGAELLPADANMHCFGSDNTASAQGDSIGTVFPAELHLTGEGKIQYMRKRFRSFNRRQSMESIASHRRAKINSENVISMAISETNRNSKHALEPVQSSMDD